MNFKTGFQPIITPQLLEKAYTFGNYTSMIERLLAEGKTTGNNHSEAMLDYTRLNLQRMERVLKSVKLTAQTADTLQKLTRKTFWLVLAEAWCGDVAINLPVISMMAEKNPQAIQLRIVLRDENPALMNEFLTNGAQSIPKLICLDAETLLVLGSWGPRPALAQEMVMQHKQNPAEPYSEFVKKLMLWYAQDKGLSMQQEIVQLAAVWQQNVP